MQFVGYAADRLVGVYQVYFYAHDKSVVYPLLGRHPCGLAYNAAEITLGETHAVGVIGYVVLFVAMLIDKLYKSVEDRLITAVGIALFAAMTNIQVVEQVYE